MTRKRFVKNLMARGISRNRANEIARRHSQSRTYADFNGFDFFTIAMAGLGGTAKRATKRFNRLFKKIERALGDQDVF